MWKITAEYADFCECAKTDSVLLKSNAICTLRISAIKHIRYGTLILFLISLFKKMLRVAVGELVTDASAYTVGYVGEQLDLLPAVTLILSLGIGSFVGCKTGKWAVEGIDGKVYAYGESDGSLGSEFSRNDLQSVLEREGLTIDDFQKLRLQDIDTLTDDEKTLLKSIRESIPMPDENVLMQKVIPASDIEKYMDGTYTQVGGYVTRLEDVTQLKSYDDLYQSLRLDYPGSVYNPQIDDSIGVIRYTTEDCSKIEIPYGVEMGGNVTEASPFTGNGFTKATNGEVIPEFKCNGYIDVKDGAQLIEISKDGSETLVAIYSELEGQFIPIE